MDSDRLHSFKLDQRGVARIFGELEAAVMEAVWRLGEPTVADVCAELGADTSYRDANYKTVMTVMNRLVAKQVLARRRVGRAFLYSASESRDELVESISRRVVEGLLQDFGALAVAQFVDALDSVDPRLIAELQERVRARSAAGEERP
jgi:predicted transcriptional regulator